jgi:hypothetical protein
LKAGTRRALIDSPAADFQRDIVDQLQVAWSADDRVVAVTGTFLPLGPGATGSKRPCGAAVIRIADGHVDGLIDHANPKAEPVSSVSWSGADHTLLVQSGSLEEFEYDQRQQSWRLISRRPHARVPAVALTIQQDLNNPPVLAARDSHSGGRPNSRVTRCHLAQTLNLVSQIAHHPIRKVDALSRNTCSANRGSRRGLRNCVGSPGPRSQQSDAAQHILIVRAPVFQLPVGPK